MFRRKKTTFLCLKFFSCLIVFVFLCGCGCGKEKEVEKPSAVDLVKADFQKGKLDYETSLLYQIYAVYEDSKLPKKYRSKEPTRAGDRIFNELMRNWKDFSPENKKRFEPFMVNPLDEKSYYRQSAKNESSFVKEAYAAGPSLAGLNSLTTNNNKVKIWYRAGEEQQAAWVLEAFDDDNIYEREIALMGKTPISDNGGFGDDAKLDIFFKSMSDMGVCHGAATSTQKTSAYIELNKTMSKKEMKSTAAHELFHAIQYAFDCFEKTWWQEQTATWCEDYIYPTYDTEQVYLRLYFRNYKMRESLTKQDDYHEYGSYVWALYLSQKHGDSMIKKVWDACEPQAVGAIKALKTTVPGGLEEAFKEFSSWVYNKEPVKKFKDKSGSYLQIEPSRKNVRVRLEPGLHVLTDIEHLALTIERYWIKPQDKTRMRSVEFDLNTIRNNYPDLAVWAIVKIVNEDAELEDWTPVSFKNFCFDLPEEDLEEIVFIFSNTHSVNKKTSVNDIIYEPREYGCKAKIDLTWTILSSWAGDWSHEYKDSDVMPASMTGKINFSESGQVNANFLEMIIDPDDPDDPESGKQLVPSGSFSLQQKTVSQGTWAPTLDHAIGGSNTIFCNASDSWDKNNESKNKYAKLYLKITGPEKQSENVSEEDLNMLPSSMQQQMRQLMDLANNMESQLESYGMINEPKEGELKYDLRIYFDWLPATESLSPEPSKIKPEPIELEGIFDEEERNIALDKTININGGTARLQGILRLSGQ